MMMELSRSLTLNEEALQQIPSVKRPVFIFEWLRFLDTVLLNAQQADIKDSQRKLVEQLTNQIECSPGPPTRKLIARCLATLFSVGDTFLLFDTVNKCNDILKNKDDSPSFLPARLAALCCVGSMYEKLGRMMGRSYEETVIILIRSLRGAESQVRVEIMNTLEKICAGMGSAIHNIHKEIYKACRHCLIDRVMSVRCAASRCLLELLNHTALLYTIELESLATLCFRAFDGSNYEARCAVAKLLGALIAMTQQNPKGSSFSQQKQNTKAISLEEALSVLMLGFLRGGSGFLKGPGEMIKGSSSVNREVRLGVTHAYVIFVQILGGMWLERNITSFLSHVLDLVANPKAASSHVDAVYSRRCINFILRSVIGKMLSEKAQFAACKEIMQFITKQMKSIDYNPENAKDCNQETLFSQHLLVCALQELGSLTLSLGTTAQYLISDASLDLIEGVMMVLIHPCYAARLAAAWCLRCICIAVPSQITPLIDRCIINIEKMRVHPEAISGYSAALAAMLGGVRLSPLGIPHTKGKVIFNIAEELLRSANQNSRLSLHRTQAGWLLIGSIMTLGIPVVRGLLPRMLLLWRNSFPRSNKELESEKARGDAFTWQVTLEGRAGALSAIHSLVLHCPEILTEDILRRLLIPIECALAMLTNISAVLKTYGQNLKAPVVMVRLRLYETLLLLPPQAFEGSYTHLLRMLVAEFTLTENHANTTTSLLRSACHIEDSVILGTRLQETDHRTIEDQLQPNSAAGSGALEHDPCCLYRQLPVGEIVPGPLPLGVAVIDMSVQLFGQIFPRVANKHKLQMLDHFAECIKNTKSSRQEAVQMNVFAALLSGLRGLTEAKTSLGQEDVKKCAAALIIGAITSPNAFLRCAAGESMGRLAQVVGDSRFTAELAQTSFDRLKSARDVASRTGHSLALGCLHRYVGGMGSSQHLNTSVSILLALAQDTTSAIVQMWSLHALALISDSGGPMFRSYVEPTLSLTLKLLLNVPQSYVDVHQCIGKVLSSLITTIGPELQGNTNTICTARSSFLCACSIMQDHPDPLVQAEATGCLQQLHLFVPRHVNLSSLVPTLCRTLSSNHLLLRKAAISCLRQLVHREAKEVCDHALTLANESCDTNIVEGLVITETGLPGVLFSMLDTETDIKLIADIHEILISMLQTLAADNLSQWLGLCKDVLTVSSESSTNSEEGGNNTLSSADERDIDGDDDLADLGVSEDETAAHRTIQPRWPTRVFAAECVRRIINVCSSVSALPAHFDLITAKETHSKMNRGDYLVLHLSNLMRMAFMAATSDCDPLRLEGLKLLQEVIEKFASVPEPEFPGHLLLEQYQAQVGAALRPAFSQETPSHVTAAACEVCSTWIGSRVARDLNDLRRVHQLLVSSLSKLHYKTSNVKLYNESLSTLEKLAILKAWAEVYVVSMSRDGFTGNESAQSEQNIRNEEEVGSFERKNNGKSLSSLVLPQLGSLSKYWFAALRDYALVSLPPEFSSQLPHDGGAFYTTDTMDSARPHYFKFWPPILNAAALWLSLSTLDTIDTPESEQNSSTNVNIDEENGNTNIQALNTSDERFHLLFGICMRSLSNAHNCQSSETLIQCLQGLHTILGTSWGHELLMSDVAYPVELCCVLYRLQMTNDTHTIQLLSMKVIKQIVTAAQEQLDIMKKTKQKELIENTDLPQELDLLGEGGSNGILPPHSSVVVSVLNVCVCVLIRHFPTIHSTMSTSLGLKLSQSSNRSDLANKVVVSTFNILERLLHLCSPLGALEIVPVILYLTTEVIKECAIKSIYDTVVLANNPSIQVALHCFSFIAMHKYCKNEQSEHQWKILLKSALAKIVDFAKMSNEENKVDEVTIMLVIAVFILHAPPEVISVPSLQYPCINQLRQCFQSNNPAVKLKAVQTMFSIFGHTNRSVATPYIQALAPQLIESLHTEINIHMFSETDLTVTLEVIATLDALVNIAKPPNRTEILTLLVLILVNFLLDSKSYNAANNPAKSLHEKCLQWLMKIGPKHPEEFKIVISQSVYMRTKLEEAIRRNQNTQSKIKVECSSSKNVVTQQPSIKLKTDFSNFS